MQRNVTQPLVLRKSAKEIIKSAIKNALSRGGMMIHNYRKIFEEHGFEMLHYTAKRTPVEWHGEQHYLIIGVAKYTADV